MPLVLAEQDVHVLVRARIEPDLILFSVRSSPCERPDVMAMQVNRAWGVPLYAFAYAVGVMGPPCSQRRREAEGGAGGPAGWWPLQP